MTLTRSQAESLATAATRIRDDWSHPGVMRVLEQSAPLGSPADVAVALFRLAGDPTKGPGLLPLPGPHWQGTAVAERRPPTMCGEHPHPAISCPECAVIQSDHESGLRAVRAALADGSRYLDPHTAATQRDERRTAYHREVQRLATERKEARA